MRSVFLTHDDTRRALGAYIDVDARVLEAMFRSAL